MGDYNNSLCFNSNGGDYEVIRSGDCSVNGDYSAKIHFSGTTAGYVRYNPIDEFINNHISDAIKFSANIKTPSQVELCIYYLLNGQYTMSKVLVPGGSDGLFELSVTIPEGITKILFSIDNRTTYSFDVYTDNWSLIVE